MRTTAILGIILMGLGIACLAYFVAPMRLMFESPMGLPKINLLPPIFGAVALICGIVLSFGVRPKTGDAKTGDAGQTKQSPMNRK